METAITSTITAAIVLLIREAIAAFSKSREQNHDHKRTDRKDALEEAFNLLAEYKKDKASLAEEIEELRQQNVELLRQNARYETWASMVQEDLKNQGITLRPLRTDDSSPHIPLKEGG